MTRVGNTSNRAQAGFSFVEMLTALLILVVLTGLVASSIPSAYNSYRASVRGANAQLALSTTATVLRDELSLATECEFAPDPGSKTVVRYLGGNGYWATLAPSVDGAMGTGVQKTVYKGDSDTSERVAPLIPNSAITDELRVTYDKITYDKGVFIVEKLRVVDDEGNALAHIKDSDGGDGNYLIRSIGMKD